MQATVGKGVAAAALLALGLIGPNAMPGDLRGILIALALLAVLSAVAGQLGSTSGQLLGRARRAVESGLSRVVPQRFALAVTIVGAVATIVSTMLPWTWTPNFPGDLTVAGNPGGNQVITLALGVLALVYALVRAGVPRIQWLAPRGSTRALQALGWAALASTWYVLIEIVVKLNGIANWVTGSWVALFSVLILLLGSYALAADAKSEPERVRYPAYVEAAAILVFILVGMFVAAYGIGTDFTEKFVGWVIAVGFAAWGLSASGLLAWLSELSRRDRITTSVSAFLAALLFVFLQRTDAVNNVADNILIFATVALGLNIVVGLAGLLDLGYVAFLGVGAYSAALVSGAASSRFAHTALPFWAAILIGVAAALIAGVIIGAPTLRLRGDYLAIVTLGFGEIFRITVNNLNGVSGPKLTNGAEGVYGVPDLKIFGYDFEQPHHVLGHTFARFANYYLLLLVAIALVVFIFARVNESRIGRAWVAIREDETAAGAMGISGFRFKLLAFALGASLAGLAGTIQAHLTSTVTPDQYVFAATSPPNSSFLLAAVVLGGMGTIGGPLLGAALLYLIPYKLQAFQDKQLLLFGLALILMMRFRPEGLVPNRRRQLEFHEKEIAVAEAHQVALAEAGQAGAMA
jgi:branched-chain amino acid transport system permease protein